MECGECGPYSRLAGSPGWRNRSWPLRQGGVRLIVDLESGKPTVRMKNVLRVVDALGGDIRLSGLPSAALPVSLSRQGAPGDAP
jgi:hypothetical protein